MICLGQRDISKRDIGRSEKSASSVLLVSSCFPENICKEAQAGLLEKNRPNESGTSPPAEAYEPNQPDKLQPHKGNHAGPSNFNWPTSWLHNGLTNVQTYEQ